MNSRHSLDLSDKRVVITQNQLIDFAGSEIVTLELATIFSRAGARVAIVTNSLGNPMMNELNRLNGVNVFVNQESEFREFLIDFRPNLVWVHHQLLPQVLLDPSIISVAGYVFHHMSPYHPTEFPVFSRLEAQIANLILFNSIETKNEILSKGVFERVPEAMLDVFGNPAPDEFLGVREYSKKLKSVLIVTNHLVDELKEAKDLLVKQNITVTILGQNGDKKERVTPQLIRQYDVVISIGKTIQYALLSRTPVYVYDHFGGPGYLSKKNIELSRERNFSGRNGGKRSPLFITNEIIEGYDDSVEFMKTLNSKYLDNYRLSVQLQRVLEKVNASRKNKDNYNIGNDQIIGLQKVNELNRTIQDILRVYNRESDEFKTKINELNTLNVSLEEKLKLKEEYISKVRSSVPYRIYIKIRKFVSFFSK